MRRMHLGVWFAWMGANATLAGYLYHRWHSSDRTLFLPGPTSHGHYQIELDCHACHTPWMGVRQESCRNCHQEELDLARDSHPQSKFTDPRHADRLEIINAADCVICHREHMPDRTRAMGVTMPDDYCYFCHQQTLTDRPSHREFSFESCSTSGCHNYHDNTALYEAFLLSHLDEPDILETPRVPPRSPIAASNEPLTETEQDSPSEAPTRAEHVAQWSASAHARAGINCTGCHTATGGSNPPGQWTDHPDHTACASCHRLEVDGFLRGHHGMRLARGLPPMTPAEARLPMSKESAHRPLTCAACHGAHDFNTRLAAVEACLSCHQDTHSLAYTHSPHFALWQAETAGAGEMGSGVSCATCHLPIETFSEDGSDRRLVQHNQNANLRPNEKMIRGVCLHCHGLEFALDALADPNLIETNFRGRPARHVESLDLAQRRQRETQTSKQNDP